MNKQPLIAQLRRIAAVLEPFSHWRQGGPNALHWNGNEYARPKTARLGDPEAAMWRNILQTLADMIEYQNCDLSDEQRRYIKKQLLGGMGSLHDYWLDDRQFGEEALTANKTLEKEFNTLHEFLGESSR